MAKVERAKAQYDESKAVCFAAITVEALTRVNGKKNEKGEYIEDQVRSTVTFNFDDPKATTDFAARGALIAWQQLQRNAGVIVEEDNVSIADLAKRSGGGGFKLTPDSIAAKVKKMPVDEYRATLTNLGLPKSEIDKLVKKQYSTK
jgi:hypothetical protein